MSRVMLYSGLEESTYDAGGRLRTSQLTTLFDGKTLGADNPNTWNLAGDGTNTFSNNKNIMSVTSGQFLIRQSNSFCPYFSGKSQLVECTFDNFQPQANVVKRVGYFSSNETSPFNSSLDGFFLESTGTSIAFKIYNNGTEILNLDWTLWSNYAEISTYDWSKFTIIMFDFLWLGGKDVRLFIETPDKSFVLAHTFHHAGNNVSTFIKSPNQPVRYEVRSTTGVGSMTAICSQVSSEGSFNENSEMISFYNTASISCNAIGTVYALKGIKKQTAFRDLSVRIHSFGLVNTATTDAGILLLLHNPTLSAPLTYANSNRLQEATATNQTVSNTGFVISAIPVSSSGVSLELTRNYMSYLHSDIGGTLDEYVVAYMPTTTNQAVNACVSVNIY